MKRIVADLVVGTHGENSLPGCLECSTKKFAVCGARGIACVSIRSFVSQTCRELLPDDVRDRGSVPREARKARTQRAFTRRTQFATDRIIVMQIERAQEGLERQSLERERAELFKRRQHFGFRRSPPSTTTAF